MGLLSRLAAKFRPATVPRKASACFDDAGVSCRWPDGEEMIVSWVDLQEIGIQTTDGGPFVEDVFLVLRGGEVRCVIPLEATGFTAVLSRLRELPGFDNDAVISAMTCTDNAAFPCWRRAGS